MACRGRFCHYADGGRDLLVNASTARQTAVSVNYLCANKAHVTLKLLSVSSFIFRPERIIPKYNCKLSGQL